MGELAKAVPGLSTLRIGVEGGEAGGTHRTVRLFASSLDGQLEDLVLFWVTLRCLSLVGRDAGSQISIGKGAELTDSCRVGGLANLEGAMRRVPVTFLLDERSGVSPPLAEGG